MSYEDFKRRTKEELNEDLLKAAKNGKTDNLNECIKDGADITTIDWDGCNALHIAAKHGQTNIGHLLISDEFDINVKDKTGNTALHHAASTKSTEFAKLLIDGGINLDIQNKTGNTALHYAASKKSTEFAKLLIDGGINLDIQNEYGDTALHQAAFKECTEFAKLLTDSGIDLNIQNKTGNTALHIAVFIELTEFAKLLIVCGFDLNIKNKDEQTALHMATSNKTNEIAESLIKGGIDYNLQDKDGLTTLHAATKVGNIELVCLLIDCGSDLNIHDKTGKSALHHTASNSQTYIAKLLIDSNIDLNLQNKDGKSALHCAVSNQNSGIVKFLIDRGIDLNLQDKDGWTALHTATFEIHNEENTTMIRFLIGDGSCLNLQDKNGKTALHYTTAHRYTVIAKLLIDCGIDPTLQEKNGLTTLHAATHREHTNLVQLLVVDGRGLNLKDKNGKSALHYATAHEQTEIAKLLIRYGVETTLQDNNDWTALHAAINKEHTKLVQLLIGDGRCINLQDKDGQSALYHAVLTKKLELVKLLVVGGINVNLQEKHGWTALHNGAWTGEVEIVKLIIKNGIHLNAKTKDNSTALHIAANNGNTQLVVLLISKGIVVNSKDKNGNSALHHAAWNGHEQIARSLINVNIAVNLQNKDGNTALHFAVLYQRLNIVYLLLDHGVKLNLQDRNGNTALHIVAGIPDSVPDLKLITYFLDSNCDTSIRNFEGKKPIDETTNDTVIKLIENYENKNALHGLPFEVKKLDKNSAKVFSQILEEESYPHFESRVMLAGEQGTGKTTIARYLVGKQPTRTKRSTDGIELYNGLSYMDHGENDWLGGKQDFSLEEIIISRSLLKEDKTTKRYKVQDTAPINQEVLDMPINQVFKQKTKTHDAYQPDLKHKIYSSESRPGRLVFDEKSPDGFENQNENIVKDYQTSQESTDSPNYRKNDDAALYREEQINESDDPCLPTGFPGDRQTTTVTQPGVIRRLKTFFGVTKKVGEVKVSVTKNKLLKMSSEVGRKKLHSKKIAPIIIWDFGGQDVFYSTHQTFLTYRAIYMIVLDGSRQLDDICIGDQYLPGKTGHKTARDYLIFWINTIVTYCKGNIQGFPKIMVVLTHKDKVKASEVDNKRLGLFAEIRELFAQTPLMRHLVINDQIFVDAKNKHDPEMQKIKDVIIRESENQPTWGESLPKCFIPLELEFASLIRRSIPLITIEHLQTINSAQPIRPLSETELKVFLKFQHSIGKILYFDEQKLDKHIILSPTFLIDAFKSFVTEKIFCKGDKIREELWDNMGKQGVVSKDDIHTVWKKKKYRTFLKDKDYLLEVMTHLDILVEPKRYDSDHQRISADFYYIASMVRAIDDTGYLQSASFKQRNIAIAYQSSSLIPPALSFRFVSYCLSVWAVKTYGDNNKAMLFHRSGVFTIDPFLDMYIICDDETIIARLVHARSNTLIMRDLASSINDCLTSALEKISQLYIRTSSDQIQTSHSSFTTKICCNSPDNPCILEHVKDNKLEHWICPSHDIEHKMHTITAWFRETDEASCEPECPVTNEYFLKERPTDLHLCRLSLLYSKDEIRELALLLGMKKSDIDNILLIDDLLAWKFEVVRKCRDSFSLTFKHIKEASEKGKIQNIHILCKLVKGDPVDFDREPEKWDLVLTEEHIDRLAPLIGGNSQRYLIELEMEFKTWERINFRHKVERDLVKLNKEILEEWRNNFCEKHTMKPTLRKITQAFSNIGTNIDIVQDTLYDLL